LKALWTIMVTHKSPRKAQQQFDRMYTKEKKKKV
jgi:hypothetical protein